MAKRNQVSSSTNNAPEFLKQSVGQILPAHRKLVVIQLSGGNDGLNTIIPHRQDSYYKNRPNINIPKKDMLFLNSEYGFNSALTGLSDLFFDGHLSIINNVGYPNPTRSHFSSLDVWHTAGDGKNIPMTGWLGRYLDATSTKGDQFKLKAIEINDTLSLALKGESYKGVSFENLEELYTELNSNKVSSFSRHYEKKGPLQHEILDYIYQTIYNGQQAVKNIYEANKKINLKGQFPKTGLGADLSTVAELILSDDETQVFYVSHGTFDTHVNQVRQHSKLLKTFGDAVKAFVGVLKQHHKFEEVCIMVFSEFGRRVQENGSKGTDHGKGNNLFLLSPNLRQPGVYNPLLSMEKLLDGDLRFEIDFRQVYATILEDWLNTPASPILHREFEKLSLFKGRESLQV